MELNELRALLDETDEALLHLFERRMALVAQVAKYKRAHAMPITDETREREKLAVLTAAADEHCKPYTAALFDRLFELSKTEQLRLLRTDGTPE